MGALKRLGLALAFGRKAASFSADTIAALLISQNTSDPPERLSDGFASLVRWGYQRCPFAWRAINDIADGGAGVPIGVFVGDREVPDHPFARLLRAPHPRASGSRFRERVLRDYLIAGDVYIRPVAPLDRGEPIALLRWRPDYVTPRRIRQAGIAATEYIYDPGDASARATLIVRDDDDRPEMIGLRYDDPLDDASGFSPLRAARSALERYNLAEWWNAQLIRNGARPSGVLSVERSKDDPGVLDPDTRERVKQEIQAKLLGPANAGRVGLFEGGLKWQTTGLSPADMEWSESTREVARLIGTALGYPPFLYGIPGDNTYSNQREARVALWEQTIIPLVEGRMNEIASALAPRYGLRAGDLRVVPDWGSVSALALRQERQWERVRGADWLTPNERRVATGYDERPEAEADQLYIEASLVPLALVDELSRSGEETREGFAAHLERRGWTRAAAIVLADTALEQAA